MTIRNLEYMFAPNSIALIGASAKPGALGNVMMKSLLSGGFAGPILPVNPNYDSVNGVVTYSDLSSLPVVPDLAVICTPPDTVPGIVKQLAEIGTKSVVIITAGFGEGGNEHGARLRQAVLDAARPHLMRIIGPNCVGIIIPGSGVNASFASTMPSKGRLAFATQSGAVVTTIAEWAEDRSIGFSHLVSLGDMIDVDFGDMLDYFANDRQTNAIVLYIEAVTNARKFISAARAAARSKPVIVVKAGRFEEGAAAASSHTGALAGADDVYDAVFRRAGVLRVYNLEELFDAVEALAHSKPPAGDRLAILTNGGGLGVLATDALIENGGVLAKLEQDTVDRLSEVLPVTWSHGNPVDIIGDAPGSRYREALEVLLSDPNADGVLVINCPTGMSTSEDAAEAVVAAVEGQTEKTVLTSWVGGLGAKAGHRILSAAGLPGYETPHQAVRAFMYLVNYQRRQENLIETPSALPGTFDPDRTLVREIIDRNLASGQRWLSEPDSKLILEAYQIPAAPTKVAISLEHVAAVASDVGFPVALKILSPDITHKSDCGGVVLDIPDADTATAVTEAMLQRVTAQLPSARMEGFSISRMVRMPDAFELILGMHEDRQFGPVIVFGQGGTAVEVIADRAIGLPPLNMKLAHELIANTRIYSQLIGFRDRKAVDLGEASFCLVKLSQLITDFAEIVEVDINPLLASEGLVIALDARVGVRATDAAAEERLAIRPYPSELEEAVRSEGPADLLIRPIRPEDEPKLIDAFGKLTPEEVRLRFFVRMKSLTHLTAARFTQIDYDREMALLLTEAGPAGEAEIFGVVRFSADPDMEHAEFAIVVRHDMAGRGYGRLLMDRIIRYARQRGIKELYGEVLAENRRMLDLCKHLGFELKRRDDNSTLIRASLPLDS